MERLGVVRKRRSCCCRGSVVTWLVVCSAGECSKCSACECSWGLTFSAAEWSRKLQHSWELQLVAMQCRICGRVFDPFAPFRFFSVAIFMYGLCRSSRVRFYGFRWCLWGVGVAGDIGQYKTVTHRGPDPQITPSNHGNSPFHPALYSSIESVNNWHREKYTEIQIQIHVCLSVFLSGCCQSQLGGSVCVCVCHCHPLGGTTQMDGGFGKRLKFLPLSILFHFRVGSILKYIWL